MIPIETLNLPIRPFNVLKRNSINYVEQVLQLGIDGLTALNGMSRDSAELVFINTTKFADLKGIPITTKQPSNLPTLAGDEQPKPRIPIHLLNLSNISRNVLKRNKIDYAEQIIELRVSGLVSRTGISNATASKIYDIAKQALNDPKLAVFENEFDIVEEHIEDRKKKLPENLNDFLSPDNKLLLPRLLPHLIKDILLFEQRERFYEVLTRRFGLEGNNTYTLDEIGLYYGLTRERVRQMEERAVEFLRGSLINADFRRKHHRVDERVIFEAKNFIKLIQSAKSPIELENVLFNLTEKHYDISIDTTTASSLRLFFEICGFHSLSGRARVYYKSAKVAWVIQEVEGGEQKFSEIWIAFDAVYRVLKEAGFSMDLFELTVEVNKPRKKNRLSKWAIEMSINLCEDIEILENGRYQLKLHKLGSVNQQVYRILSKGPRQVRDAKDICKEINLELAKLDGSVCDLSYLTNALANDERFLSAGRKGWILSEWSEIASESTVDIISKYFHKVGKPSSSKPVFDTTGRFKAIRNRR